MRTSRNEIPIYQEFILAIQKGLLLLDDDAQSEVQQFILTQQHETGAFVDRAGNPDLYYSLFGFWLASALKMENVTGKLNSFVSGNVDNELKVVDRFSVLLIQTGLFQKKKIKLRLFRVLGRSKSNINFSYQLFLVLLAVDATRGTKWWFKSIAKLVLMFYKIPDGVPCSMLAALLVGQQKAGMKVDQLQRQLLNYFDDEMGFKAFPETEHGDLLSTGVALFALKRTDFDLRLVAPVCYRLIEQSFANGAFLSGDGDQTRDLEYTFYGLLALGSLADSHQENE